jgi:cytochrome c-type biogenesis protein CcmH/NrfG
MSDLHRAVLEERRDQALRDLAEVDEQRAAGELDDATAERLARLYEGDLAAAMEALDEPDAPRSAPSRRTLVGIGVAVASVVAVGVLVATAVEPRPPGGLVTGGVATEAVADGGGRDLSTVSNAEMEEVIAANPTVVPMRLALVERYLRDGALDKAQRHAAEALQHDPGTTDRARALRYLGWTTALLGDPTNGADLLERSLELVPDDLDGLWFLANVRLEGLGDPAGAVPLLEQLLAAEDVPAPQRERVQATLDQARRP